MEVDVDVADVDVAGDPGLSVDRGLVEFKLAPTDTKPVERGGLFDCG